MSLASIERMPDSDLLLMLSPIPLSAVIGALVAYAFTAVRRERTFAPVEGVHRVESPPPEDPGRELELASAVQQRLSPRGVVRVPGFAVTGYHHTVGACGGDWWSCHALPDGCVLLAVGDVTGHGLPAALVAVLARGIVEGVAFSLGEAATPTRVLATLATSIAELGDDRLGMTCCVVVLDPATGLLQLASAGHPFPYIRRGGGELEVVVARGAPLGSSSPMLGTARACLSPGDMLLLTSDGLADRARADGRRFGDRRVRRLLAEHAPEPDTNVRRVRAEILAALRGFAADAAPDDDLTLVVCEYRERVG
jgi:serine phosphatase RsbU (regulator of sigma subunit)